MMKSKDNSALAAMAGEPGGMSPERAHNINGATLDIALVQEGLVPLDKAADAMAYLEDVSLSEMLEAKAIIEAENRAAIGPGPHTITMICDDRLIAAIYALLHYRKGEVPAMANGKLIVIQEMPKFTRGSIQ